MGMDVTDIIAAMPNDMTLDQVDRWLDTPNELLDGLTPSSAFVLGWDVDVRFAASKANAS